MAWYEVDSLTIDVGSIAWGDIARTHADDGVKLGLNEVAETPGFSYDFIFENIPGSVTDFRYTLNGYYEGDSYCRVVAYGYNYTYELWSELGTIIISSSDKNYASFSLPSADWTSGGQAKVRFIHETAGTVGHYFRIDQFIIEDLTPTTSPPTTVSPTTAVPTTTLTTVAPTSPVPSTTVAPSTTAAPTTAVPTTTLTTAAPTTPSPPTTPPPHKDELDTFFNCLANNYAGVPMIEITIEGHVLSASYGLADLELSIPITITGEVPLSALYRLDDLELSIETSITGWGIANDNKKNWVGWSKIGNVSFELDLVNDAGFRPMAWSGYVYRVLKMDKNVVIYGSGGITLAFPVGSPMPTFGFKEISIIGVKNKTAITGDEFTHFYIDSLGCLYKLTTKGLSKLGYEEFLLPLIKPTLSWDEAEHRLYISSEAVGYIYNEEALTGGYTNLTGLYRIKDSLIAASPDTIVADAVEVATDIIDFKRRGLKSIESMQFDTTSDVQLYAAIDYRYKKTDGFKTTKWSPLNSAGVAHIRTAGVEFRIRIKGLDHGSFNLSYISVQFKFIDQRFTRDPNNRRSQLDDY